MKKITVPQILIVVALVIGTLSANLALAHEAENNSSDDTHRGIFLGINVGGGQSAYAFTEGSRTIIDKGEDGAIGGLRFGYSFSNSFALSLEGFGFGQTNCEHEEEELGMGAGILALTWHPGGHGFFLRTGFGAGGGEFIHPEDDERIKIEERAAFLFSLGYDWRLNNSLTLGFSFDSMILDAGNTIGPGDDYLGASGLTVQFNWYL